MMLGLKFGSFRMKQSRELCVLIWMLVVNGSVWCQRPGVVKIGAVFSFNTVIGRASKPAMEAAVSDINQDPKILNGTKLHLITEDANCNVFLGGIEGNLKILDFPPFLVFLSVKLLCWLQNVQFERIKLVRAARI